MSYLEILVYARRAVKQEGELYAAIMANEANASTEKTTVTRALFNESRRKLGTLDELIAAEGRR